MADHTQMQVMNDTELLSFLASEDGHLRGVLVRSAGQERQIDVSGAFVFIGLDPNTGWLDGLLELDDKGFILTNRMMETSMPGVYAAGDVRAGSTKQLASAVGEGASVAMQIRMADSLN